MANHFNELGWEKERNSDTIIFMSYMSKLDPQVKIFGLHSGSEEENVDHYFPSPFSNEMTGN